MFSDFALFMGEEEAPEDMDFNDLLGYMEEEDSTA
jgi:hypothetical protein